MVNLKERLIHLFQDITFGAFPDEADCVISERGIDWWGRAEQEPTEQELEAVSKDDVEALLVVRQIREKVQEIEDWLDKFIDEVANAKRYGTINMSPTAACLAYVGYDNQYRAEAEAFGAWKASIWPIVFKIQDDYLNGKRPEPTLGIIIGELPSMMWP